MMHKKTLYLIRHAKPAYPGGARMCLGQKNDLPLSEEGQQQAAWLAQAFTGVELETVYSSPLLRARQTAAHIAGGKTPHVVLQDLIELYGGEWDGRPFSEIHAEYPEYFIPGSGFSCPPGGESDEDGLSRMRAALDCVHAQTAERAAIVAHSGVNRLLLCSLLGRPLSEKKQIPQGYACVSILEYECGIWTVKAVEISLEEIGK